MRAAGDAVQHADGGGGADVHVRVDRPRSTRVKPHRPMPTSVTPTMRSLHDDSASIGSAPRRASASRPTASTPPEWPRPHRKPARHARRAPAPGQRRDRGQVIGTGEHVD